MSGRVLLAAPRSFCAGVDRAIEIVERLLEEHGPPIYVRHHIVHNDHVVRRLEALGAVFVDHEDEIPSGESTPSASRLESRCSLSCSLMSGLPSSLRFSV